MHFVANLFSNNLKSAAKYEYGCLPWVCSNRNQPKSPTHQPELSLRVMAPNHSPSIPSKKVTSDLSIAHIKVTKIQLQNRGEVDIREYTESCDLIATINQPSNFKASNNSTTRVLIGKEQEMNCLSSLRSYCFDKVLVWIGEFGCDFQIEDFIKAEQELVFLLENQQILQKFLSSWEEGLIKSENLSVWQVMGKMFGFIGKISNLYVLSFEPKHRVQHHFITALPTLFQSCILEEQVTPFLKAISLRQYQSFKLGVEDKLANKYLFDFKKEVKKSGLKATCTNHSSAQADSLQSVPTNTYADNFDEEEEPGEPKGSSGIHSSEEDAYGKYFEGRMRENSSKLKDEMGPEIVIFHVEDEVFEMDESQESWHNHKIAKERKQRSRSEDVNYEISETCDDQLFDKY